MGRKKLYKKGGVDTLDTTAGIFLKTSLKNTEPDKLKSEVKIIDEKLKYFNDDIKLSSKNVDEELKREIQRRKDNMAIEKLDESSRYHSLTLIWKLLSGLASVIKNIVVFLVTLLKVLFEKLVTIITLVLKTIGVGNGTVLRYVLAVVAVCAIILGIAFGIKELNTPELRNDFINDLILRAENARFMDIKPPTFFDKVRNWFYSLIPNRYKYSFSSLFGSFNYLLRGKNQYENYLEKRETVENDAGRSDNIFNIHFDTNTAGFPSDKTHSILKPKNVIIEFSSNSDPNSDFNRLPDTFKAQAYFSLYDKYTIPVYAPSSNWILDINNAYYTRTDDKREINKINVDSFNNIFKYNEKKQIIYNSFDNKKYHYDRPLPPADEMPNSLLLTYKNIINFLNTNTNTNGQKGVEIYTIPNYIIKTGFASSERLPIYEKIKETNISMYDNTWNIPNYKYIIDNLNNLYKLI